MATSPARLIAGLAAAAALLPGCVVQGPFPSLAPREAERADPTAEPVRTPPAVASDPALRARLTELIALARQGERDFEAAYGPAQAAAGAAGAQGTESWVSAQEAISRLEAARAETTRALADLDRLAIERADLPTNAEDHAALLAAIEQAAAIAAGQQSRIDRLRTALSAR